MSTPSALTPLEDKLSQSLTRRLANSTLRTLTINRPSQTDFSSNDFLSLASNPALKSAFLTELQRADLPLGSGGSRLLDGNSAYAERLEADIAAFHGAQAGLLFNSGFDANAGFFASVPQRGDVVLYDALIHASVHDGMRLSRAGKCVPFAHNSVGDLRRRMEALLGDGEGGMGERLKAGTAHVFVAVEAVYSMDGDVAPLREIVEAVDEVLPRGTGYVAVDEAHATGVLGKQGRGLVCELGLEERVFARLHTFGKALACSGAIILGSTTLRSYLLNYARPLIYTTFLSYPSLVSIRTAYTFLSSSLTAPLQSQLHFMVRTLFTLLTSLSESLKHSHSSSSFYPERIPQFPASCPQSPIFSLQIPEPKPLAAFLQKRGMMVRAVVPPTVPEGTQRVRICLHAGNTVEEIRALVGSLREWCGAAPEDNNDHDRMEGKGAMLARL